MKIKKILTVLGSALMVGSTMGIAAAANYSAPFAEGTSAVVHGANADTSDVNAATQISQDLLGTEADTQTADVGVGDDSVNLGEDIIGEIYLGDNIDSDEVLYDDDLDLLASGTSGGEDYEQTLTILDSNNEVTYGDLNDEDNYVINTEYADELRPVLYFQQDSGESLWEYTLEFDDGLESEDAEGESIVLAGKEWSFAPDANFSEDVLELYSGAVTTDVNYQESQTVELDDKEYVLEVTHARSLDSTPEITLNIDGESEDLEQGETMTVGDDEFLVNNIRVDTVGDVASVSAEIFVGADILEISGKNDNPSAVDLNEEEITSIEGDWTTDSDNLQTISLKFTPYELNYDLDAEYEEYKYLEMGDSVVDPVLGTIAFSFDSSTHGLTEDKEMFEASVRGDDRLEVTFTNNRDDEFTQTVLEEGEWNILTNFTNLTRADRGEKFIFQAEGSGDDVNTHIAEITAVERDGTAIESIEISYPGTSREVSIDDSIRHSEDGLYVCQGLNLSEVSDADEENVINDSTTFSIQEGSCEYAYDGVDKAAKLELIDEQLYNGSLELHAANDVHVALPDLSAVTSDNSENIIITENEGESGNNVIELEVSDADDTEDVEYEVKLDNSDDSWIQGGEDDLEPDYGYYLTEFGSYIEAEVDDNAWVQVYTPDEDAVEYNLVVGASEEADVSQPDDTGVPVYTDAETESFADKDIVVVGGSAINAIAAELLGGDLSGEDFTAETGVEAGEFLIQSFDRDGRTALLVAGYNAADTTKAANALVDESNEISTDIGTKYVSDEATVSDAQLVSE